jgi:chaperonin GroES
MKFKYRKTGGTPMKVLPLGDRVLLKIAPAEEKTQSGLVIPATAQEKTNQGNVVAVGESEDIQVKVGQRVIYDKFAGTQVKLDGEDHLIIASADILAVVD